MIFVIAKTGTTIALIIRGGDKLKSIVKGFAVGYANIIYDETLLHQNASHDEIVSSDEELDKFESGLQAVKSDLNRMISSAEERSDEVTASILTVHKMLLEDDAIISEVHREIGQGQSAFISVEKVFDVWIKTFEAMDNIYMKERSTDLKDLKTSMLRQMIRINKGEVPEHESMRSDPNEHQNDIILFTEELTPSQLAMMDIQKLKGIVTQTGGETSHAAIMCKALSIPMLVGEYSNDLQQNSKILMNAIDGELLFNPTVEVTASFMSKQKAYQNFQEKLKTVSSNLDSIRGKIHNNLGDLEDLNKVVESKATGIGLFRTEFLFMKSKEIPSEEEQYAAYKRVLIEMNNQPVTIRTIDIGGDKSLPYLEMPSEDNPFLGYRAIRMCLGSHKGVFRTQLRAILRASVYGKAQIMFPMISNLSELKEAKAFLEEEKAKLDMENITYDKKIQVGIMIEVPSAAIAAKSLSKYVDFFSIGTNDLTQYTMASDRMNPNVAYLYSYFEPAVLELVKQTIYAANQAGIDVSVCGEMASNPMAIPLLKAMGLKKYSVSPSRTDATNYILNRLYNEGTSLLSHSEKSLLELGMERHEIINELQDYMEHVFDQELSWL